MFHIKRYDFKRYHIALLVVVVILGLIGAYLVKQVQSDADNFFLKHLVGITGGIILALIISLIDYHFICSFYIVLYIINLILLVWVKVAGVEINYAKRWINLIFFNFQPSELTKIILILFLATVYSNFRAKINHIGVITVSLISVLIPVLFILDQPNLSTSMIILFIFVMMIFAAGLKWKIILPVILIGLPTVMGLFWYIQQDYQGLLNDYQQKRVLSLLHPEEYPEIMYQQDNSVQAIGSGQLYGKLFSDSAQRNYDSIPIAESDFIFSVAGEEFGFIGCCLILVLYGIVIAICLSTAKKAPDFMGMLISVGIASLFMFQVFVNIGVTASFLPNTGVPLPFLSSGLSSLISGMIAIGLILNIRIQPKRHRS